jgi:hypothetical protein
LKFEAHIFIFTFNLKKKIARLKLKLGFENTITETKTMEKYELVKDIGSGNFGVARLMRNKETKELVAMKYIERGRKVSTFFSQFIENPH